MRLYFVALIAFPEFLYAACGPYLWTFNAPLARATRPCFKDLLLAGSGCCYVCENRDGYRNFDFLYRVVIVFL